MPRSVSRLPFTAPATATAPARWPALALAGIAIALAAACAPAPPPATPHAALPDPEPIEVGVVPPPLPYAPGFDALHYHVALTVPADGRRIEARTRIAIALDTPLQDTLRLDLTGLRVHGVAVGVGVGAARSASFYQADGRLVLPVPATAAAGDTLHVDVEYGGQPTDGLVIGQNVHGQPGAFGDNWPNRARFWFPSIDHPSDKATVSFEVRAPAGWRVLANGRQTAAGAMRTAETGTVRAGEENVWRYELPVPIPTYLMVIGAAPFAVDTIDACADGGVAPARPDRCVAVTSWTFPPDRDHGLRVFRRAGEMVEYYTRVVGPYPYTKLAHAQSATRFGGMENAGAIFYSQQAMAARRDIEGTVAHETAHQWFGNAVTPHDWPHLWLSEGFATYYGALFFEHADGVEAFRQHVAGIQRSYLRSQVRDLAMVDTLAVPGNNLLGLLNANSYQKGGAVLHMLRGLLGDDVFFPAIRGYYQDHVHGTAVTADLRRALEARSGQELAWYFDQWVYQPGHPELHVEWRWEAGGAGQTGGDVVIHVEQVQDPAWPTFRLPVELDFATPGGVIRRDVVIDQRRQTLRVPLPAAPTEVVLDPEGWMLAEMEVRPVP
jgi:aminopeptidase N